MLSLSQFRRPRRAGEWTESKAVTFIVALAATRSVTLVAVRAGMSRKSAFALKRRDARFAMAWAAAVDAVTADWRHEPALNSFRVTNFMKFTAPVSATPMVTRPAGCRTAPATGQRATTFSRRLRIGQDTWSSLAPASTVP